MHNSALSFAVALIFIGSAGAQDAQPPIEEVVVLGKSGIATRNPRQSVSFETIQTSDPIDLSAVILRAPSVHIQTNSRGETLVFLRGAGERQVALFYDGALLNVPWDNRVDLSLIPATMVGRVDVAVGATSVEYGANVAGGALNILTRSAPSEGSRLEFGAAAGQADRFKLDALASGAIDGVEYVISASYLEHGDVPLPKNADLPFNQTGSSRRTNTDKRIASGAAKIFSRVGEHGVISGTFLLADAKKGVAAEGHRDPDQTNPRFWRYPDWRLWMGIANGEWVRGPWLAKGSFWLQGFDQTIQGFTDNSYTVLENVQRDDDFTLGARGILRRDVGANEILLTFNGLQSTHREREQVFTGGNVVPGARRELFRQRILSIGAEYLASFANQSQLILGVGLDRFSAPLTGIRPGIAADTALNATAAIDLPLSGPFKARLSLARKTRFPTMRELFGTALNRFLPNPDLKPERNFTVDLDITYESGAFGFTATPFYRNTKGTIDQRTVTVAGEPLRQRINLRGSRIYGLDVTADWRTATGLHILAQLTALDIKRRRDMPADPRRLSEKPKVVARFAADYQRGPVQITAEVLHRGRAFSLDDTDAFVALNVSTTLNLALRFDLAAALGGQADRVELYLRADNLTDAVIEPQLGLPDAGRWITGGLRLAF